MTTYRVTFAKRYQEDGQPSALDPSAELDTYLADGIVLACEKWLWRRPGGFVALGFADQSIGSFSQHHAPSALCASSASR